MRGNEGFGVYAGAVASASDPMGAAGDVLRTYAEAVEAACSAASAAAGFGPLSHALSELGGNAAGRARERADLCHLLARELCDTAGTYLRNDAEAAGRLVESRWPR